MKKILIVDDDGDLRGIVRDVLKAEGFFAVEAEDGLEAIKIFKADMPDVVLLDMKMPHMDGIETMQQLRRFDESVPVIILTAHGDIPTAITAIRCGAYDFMVKPPEFEKLIVTIGRALEKRTLEMEVERANASLESSLESIFGISEAVKPVIKQIQQVSQTDLSVIIQGETGTGKSVIAGTIQNMSKRAGRPFVCVDIGLIPDQLVESELFGYKKGAFTGADKDKKGYLQTAHTGTIFIDELENMSLHVQGKLLSFIEKKLVYPLGSTNPVDIDVRVITATNNNILDRVQKKLFREDLYFRLSEFVMTLPPLRERIEDILFFANKFVFDACSEMSRQVKQISDEALSLMKTYHWPGNLRELKNVMRRAVLLAEGDVIESECIVSLIERHYKESSSTIISMRDAMKDFERNMIRETLKMTGGIKSKAAELLEMSYPSLLAKIKEYDIKM
jgi:DNA-binding NtrC family response regulator